MGKNDFSLLEDVTVGGLQFQIRKDAKDLVVVEDNLLKHPYEKKFPIVKDENWIDVGGHIGSFAIRVLSVGGKVCSFEPDPTHVEMYKKNHQLNGFSPLVHQAAVVQKIQSPTVSLYRNTHRGNFGGNSLINRWKTPRPTVEVSCISFKDCIDISKKYLGEKNLNLKLDCEGSEIEILENISPEFNKIVCEYHYSFDPSIVRIRNIRDRLTGLGYSVMFDQKLPEKGDVWKNPRKPFSMIYAILE
jgi:FkbM family methyltransferase